MMSYPFIFLSCILADFGYDLVRYKSQVSSNKHIIKLRWEPTLIFVDCNWKLNADKSLPILFFP